MLADCPVLPVAGVPRGAQGRAGRGCEAVDQRGYCTARRFSKCTPSSPALLSQHQVLLPQYVIALGHECLVACTWFLLPLLLQSALHVHAPACASFHFWLLLQSALP